MKLDHYENNVQFRWVPESDNVRNPIIYKNINRILLDDNFDNKKEEKLIKPAQYYQASEDIVQRSHKYNSREVKQIQIIDECLNEIVQQRKFEMY